jgi:hypothetical protein
MSTWEERMAAKAAARRHAQEQVEREAEAARWADLERREAAWRATLPPCPCALDPCPYPPRLPGDVYYDGWWEWHRRWWEQLRRTGRCPGCDQPLSPAEVLDHDCPNAIALAG